MTELEKLLFLKVIIALSIIFSEKLEAQNNSIFFGGISSGGAVFCYSQSDAILNNSIFVGGIASGENVFCYSQSDASLNNSIFAGGMATGESVFCYTQSDFIFNNSIFTGGIASGESVFCYTQSDLIFNNSIFSGGIATGESVFCYSQSDATFNNSIFAGGIASGESVFCFSQSDIILNNIIFAGGIASGESVFCYSQSDLFVINNIYRGGITSGENVFCYAQGDAPHNNNIFRGGVSLGQHSCVGTLSEVPLPISLIYFEAICKENDIIFYWQTASEINNDFFTIEKTKDGIIFDVIHYQKGAGNSNSLLNYKFEYAAFYNTSYYFRLRQTDFDGQNTSTDLIHVYCDKYYTTNIIIYPNPNTGVFTIEGLVTDAELIIANPMGKTVLHKRANSRVEEIDLSNQSPGIYYLFIIMHNQTEVEKVIIHPGLD